MDDLTDDGYKRTGPRFKFVIPGKQTTASTGALNLTRRFSFQGTEGGTVCVSKNPSTSGTIINGTTKRMASTNTPEENKERGKVVCFDDTNTDNDDALSSAIFHNVKQKLEYSLSERRRGAANSLRRARASISILREQQTTSLPSDVMRQVRILPKRIKLPRFLSEHRDDRRIRTANDEVSSSDASDDPEFREYEERSQIVEKYEKGPEQEVEEWENPNLNLYKVTDRYGFMHKDTEELLAQEQAEKKRMAKEVSREQKWLRMISQWTDGKMSEKFRRRVWKGIPEKVRSLVWARLLDISRYQKERKGNVYKELLMRARLISKDIKQIDLDINRTYRDHLAFRRRYDVKQQSLFNVLAAYAMYNTEVGYCQGMSQIAALFLMYMDEEEAFWCLHALLVDKKHSMHGFFIPGFPKLVRFQAHFERILQKYLPRLKKHLDKAGIPPIYVTKWWFGCFLDRVPFPLALRLWDVFLLEGDVILTAMAYNIMKMHERTIRKLQMENFMEFIQTVLAQDFGFSDEETMHSLQECLKKLHSDRMLVLPSPGPNEPAEIPKKPFGPVLSRSMVDIRLDIAEIQSRCSRANSVAGRSPMLNRRYRMPPPSPTPVSRYQLSQLPSWRTDALAMEKSPSSISSSSTIKETKEQSLPPMQPPLPSTTSPKLAPKRQEMEERLPPAPPPRQQPLVRAPIRVAQTRGVYDTHARIPMTYSNSPYRVPSPPSPSRNAAEGDVGIWQQQSHQRRPTALSDDSHWLPSKHFDTPVYSSIARRQDPPLEPPIDYEQTEHGGFEKRRAFSSSDSRVSSTPMSRRAPQRYPYMVTSFDSRSQSTSGNNPESAHLSTPTSAQNFAGSSSYRDSADDTDGAQKIARHRSFYDNVPSPTPRKNESSDGRQRGDSHQMSGTVLYAPRVEDNVLGRHFGYFDGVIGSNDSRIRHTDVQGETRVMQTPNNVTYVRVGESSGSSLEDVAQRRIDQYSVPIRGAREACGGDSRSNASYRREKETSPTSYLHRYEASFPVDLEEFDSPQRRETAVSPREQRYVHDRHRARTRSDHAEYTDGHIIAATRPR